MSGKKQTKRNSIRICGILVDICNICHQTSAKLYMYIIQAKLYIILHYTISVALYVVELRLWYMGAIFSKTVVGFLQQLRGAGA